MKKKLLPFLILFVPFILFFSLVQNTQANHYWDSAKASFSYHQKNESIIYVEQFKDNKHFWFYASTEDDFDRFSALNPFDSDYHVYVTKTKFSSKDGPVRFALKMSRAAPKNAELWEFKYNDNTWEQARSNITVKGNGPEAQKKIVFGNIGGRIIWENGEILKNGGWKPEDWKTAYVDSTVNLYPIKEKWASGKELKQYSIKGFDYDNPPGDTYYSGFSLKDTVGGGLYPGKYKLQHYWKNDDVTCDKGAADTSFAFDKWCAITVKGTVRFTLSENGEITVDSQNTDEGNSAKNVNDIKLDGDGKTTDLNKGINLVMKVEVDSPLHEALANAINWLVETLNDTIEYLSGWVKAVLEKGSEIDKMQRAWKIIRDISLSLLTLGILIIAFANVLNLDIERYGVQKIIPKLVIGVILTYFSFLIAKIFLEISDVLTVQFRETLSAIGETNNGEVFKMSIQISQLDANEVISMIGTIIFMAILLMGVIISLIYLTLVLLLRIIIINFLVVIAPVAFVLGIMPFTESLAKRWWSTFTQWVFMGPAVMGMLLIGNIIINATYGDPTPMIPTENNTGDLASMNGPIAVATAAVAYFLAAQIPMMMAGEAKGALSSWSNKVKGMGKWTKDKALVAPMKAIDNRTGISRAYKGWRSEIGKRHDESGEVLLHKLSDGKLGTSRELINERRRDNEVKRHMENIGDNMGPDDLRTGAENNSGAQSEAYLRKLAEKDFLTKSDLTMLYKACGINRGDSVLMANRTKHGSWENDIRNARNKAGATADNIAFGEEFINRRLTSGQVKDLGAEEFASSGIANVPISQRTEMKQQQLNTIFMGDEDVDINDDVLATLRKHAGNLRDAGTDVGLRNTAIEYVEQDTTLNKNKNNLSKEQLYNIITGKY